MTKNNPASTPCGINPSTCNNGGLIVTRISSPCAKFVTRCSTTRSVYTSCLFFSLGSGRVRTTQRDAVWKGACGIKPLGNGRPSKPAIPVTNPRRKKSQSDVRDEELICTKSTWFFEVKFGSLTD